MITVVSEKNIMEMTTIDKMIYIAEPINAFYQEKFISTSKEAKAFTSNYIK